MNAHPDASPAAFHPTEFGSDEPTKGHAKRLLIVEDDTDMSLLLNRIARELDRDLVVRSVRSVHEATAMLEEETGFDLVLADFMLADSRNGWELRDLCADRAPNSRFALMSSMPLDFPDFKQEAFLQKPFSPGEATDFLRSHLDY